MLPDNVTEIAVKAAQTSLSWCKFARNGRREGLNRRDASPPLIRLPVVPCASLPVTHVSRSSFVLDQRAKNEASEDKAALKGLFAGSVVHICYAGIDTEHPTFYCFAVLFTWPRWRAILTTSYQLYLLLNCRWLQMPCAACFQLNVHPGKNSFHCKHTSFDCTYMFWRLLGIYQVFFCPQLKNF